MAIGGNMFDNAKKKDGVANSEKEGGMLGASYNYIKHIKSPAELGMSAAPSFNALADDVSGLLSYIELLVTGSCKLGDCAGKNVDENGRYINDINGPLGNKFFVETATTCKDKATGETKKRSIYVNNIPDGSIPLISNIDSNTKLDSFKGLIPGLLGNIAQIRPTQILLAFTNGSNPPCHKIQMEVSNKDGSLKLEPGYVINSDIDIMPNSWFPSIDGLRKENYDLTPPKDDESFINKGDNNFSTSPIQQSQTSKIDYSKMPNDCIIRFYYSMLGLLGLYILLRLLLKKK
jgi:hypothetical protein